MSTLTLEISTLQQQLLDAFPGDLEKNEAYCHAMACSGRLFTSRLLAQKAAVNLGQTAECEHTKAFADTANKVVDFLNKQPARKDVQAMLNFMDRKLQLATFQFGEEAHQKARDDFNRFEQNILKYTK